MKCDKALITAFGEKSAGGDTKLSSIKAIGTSIIEHGKAFIMR